MKLNPIGDERGKPDELFIPLGDLDASSSSVPRVLPKMERVNLRR